MLEYSEDNHYFSGENPSVVLINTLIEFIVEEMLNGLVK